MDEDAKIVQKFAELSPEAKAFLSKIDSEDVELMKDGLNLIKSMRTVSKFMKWLILTTLAVFFGIITFWESVNKFANLWKGMGK